MSSLKKSMSKPELLRKGARWILSEEIDSLNTRVARLEQAAERDRSRQDLGFEFAARFQEARRSDEYQAAFTTELPLVTIIIATYNRAQLLIERSVDSALNQTYRNLQVVVVGDHCTDDTFERLAAVDDPRLEVVNLPSRGDYPVDPYRRWMVAGSPAMNEGLRRARGQWVTHLDDDDRHPLHRVEYLVREAQARRVEFLWHPFRREWEDGSWETIAANDFAAGAVTTSSIFYHSWLTRIHWDINAHYSLEPGDWNRLRKFAWLDVKRERVDEVLLDHYRERANS